MTELETKTQTQPKEGLSTGLALIRETEARAAAARVARESYGKLVAYLAASSRDVPGAEDALADAFAAALAVWPAQGVPLNPEGWLATAARRRLIDAARRRRSAEAASDALTLIDADLKEAAEAAASIPDRRLALMFACAHPAIEESIRAPLMLQTILGLDAAAIASAFLVSPAAMSQRLTRAKAKIRLAGVPFRIPEREDLPQRLGVALEAIYAAFSHGWAEAFSDDPRGRNLAEEAIWLGRVVVSLAPNEPEAMGLMALMLYAHARREARRDAKGRYVPLSEQDTGSWDQAAIEEAEGLLRVRGRLGRAGTVPARGGGPIGPRRPPADRNDRLGGDRRPLRRALRPDRFSGRRRQSRGGGRPRAGGRGGAQIAGRGGSARRARRIRALLGRASRPLRQNGRGRGSAPRLRARDRPADRPGGARVSHRAAGGAGVRPFQATRRQRPG